MVNESLLHEISPFFQSSERKQIIELFMKHCGGKEKVAAQLLGKKVQAIYRYTTGAGRKKPLVPNCDAITRSATILLTSGSEDEQLELLQLFKRVFERVVRVVDRYESWAKQLQMRFPEEEISLQLKLYRVPEGGKKGGIILVPLKVCALCGSRAVFPREYEGRTLCMFCYEKIVKGLISPKQLKGQS